MSPFFVKLLVSFFHFLLPKKPILIPCHYGRNEWGGGEFEEPVKLNDITELLNCRAPNLLQDI
jgi:hypothetical protein